MFLPNQLLPHSDGDRCRSASLIHFLLRAAAVSAVATALATSATAQSAPAAPPSLTPAQLVGGAVAESELASGYENLQMAIELFTSGDILGAQDALVRAAKEHSNLPPVEIMMARLYGASGNSAAARGQIELAIRNNDEDPEAYLLLARQALVDGRLSEAALLYDQAIELTEKYQANETRKKTFLIQGHGGRAAVAERRGDYAAALPHLQQLVAVDAENGASHQRLGTAIFVTQDTQDGRREAYNHFTVAHEKNSSLPHANVVTALLFHRQGNSEEAKNFFNRAVESDGSNLQTLLAYGRWLLEIDDAAAAKSGPLAAALKLAPDSFDALVLSGIAATMTGDNVGAEGYFIDALRLSPANQSVLNQLALLLGSEADEQKRNRGLAYAQMAGSLFPNSAESQVTLGWVLYKQGQLKPAIEAMQKAQSLGISNWNADSMYFVAQFQADRNQTDSARQLLEAAFKQRGLFVHQDAAKKLLDRVSLNTLKID